MNAENFGIFQNFKTNSHVQSRSATPILLLAFLASLSGCGVKNSAGGQSDFERTIAYIAEHGLPSFSSLFPALPQLLVQTEGVSADATGLPAAPSNLNGSVLASSSPDLAALLVDAKSLSAQGFSEARRLEALIQGLMQPVFQVTDQKSLFQAAGSAALVDGVPSGAIGPGGSLFSELLELSSFVVKLDAAPGVPSHIIFSKSTADDLVHVAGVWPDAKGGGYASGFDFGFKIINTDEFSFKFALAPGVSGTMLKGWAADTCADDLWEVSIATLSGRTEAAVSSLECASTKNRLSALSLAKEGEVFSIGGAFVQSFAEADSNSLRGFLGRRQGFVLQAASSADLNSVAAAAAVLKESDFGADAQSAVNRFGVGQLLVDFVLAKYWTPKKDSISGGFLPSASDLKNFAYYTCAAPGVSSSIQSAVNGASSLCEGKPIEAESLVQTMIGLKQEVDELPVSDAVKDDVTKIVDILSIRNSIFLQSGKGIQYRDTSDQTLKSLEGARSNIIVAQLGGNDWTESTRAALKPFTASQVEGPSFVANPAKMTDFLAAQCNTILNGAQEKAGKSATKCF